MKKKLYTEEQINEFLTKIATAVLGGHAKGLIKIASKDPKLHKAISALADAKVRLDKYVSVEYMQPDAESLADDVKKRQDRLAKNLAKLGKLKRKK